MRKKMMDFRVISKVLWDHKKTPAPTCRGGGFYLP